MKKQVEKPVAFSTRPIHCIFLEFSHGNPYNKSAYCFENTWS